MDWAKLATDTAPFPKGKEYVGAMFGQKHDREVVRTEYRCECR